jgi:ferredoxin
MRRTIQFGFLVLTVVGVFVVGGNAERWCPFGGVEAIYTYLSEGNMVCSLGMSNFYILGGVLLMTVVLRRAFCGYLCPVGTVSEWLRRGAGKLGFRGRDVPEGVDRVLSLIKYPLLGVILYFTYQTAELVLRGYDPCYALISRHGKDITVWAYLIAGVVVVASLVVMMPFCRWLCPLAAVLNPFSRFGVARVQRDEDACIQCADCSSSCPMAIPVDRVRSVTHARCLACLDCVEACPTSDRPALSWGPPKSLGRSWSKTVLAGVLLLCVVAPVAAAWMLPMPSFVRERGTRPEETASVELRIDNLTCRGNCNLLMYYLERDDMDALSGYMRLEAWPAQEAARVRITYDAAVCDEGAIRRAISEPYFDTVEGFWRDSPFLIEGYDPLAIE